MVPSATANVRSGALWFDADFDQDVCISMIPRLDRLRQDIDFDQPDGAIINYLRCLVRFSCHDVARSFARQNTQHCSPLPIDAAMKEDDKPDDWEAVQIEIERLPPDQQTILSLQLAGYSLKEIARELGMPEKDVINLKNRAIAQLRFRLGGVLEVGGKISKRTWPFRSRGS